MVSRFDVLSEPGGSVIAKGLKGRVRDDLEAMLGGRASRELDGWLVGGMICPEVDAV